MRDILENFPTEKIEIIDNKGRTINVVKGLFGKTSLTITDVSIPIFEGQKIVRKLPNGATEKYEIIESKFVKGHGSICDFYKLSIEKENKKTQNYGNIYNDNSIYIGDGNSIEGSIIGDSNNN